MWVAPVCLTFLAVHNCERSFEVQLLPGVLLWIGTGYFFAKFLVEGLRCLSFGAFSDSSTPQSPFPYEQDQEEVILLWASKWQT